MDTHKPSYWLCLGSLALALVQCSSPAEREEVEGLRRQQEELQAEVERLRQENRELRGQPSTASEVYAHFAQDAARGTLAGLVPGDELEQARARFGQENRTRSWTSEGQLIIQYEWELEGGVIIRANADSEGRLTKIAVAFTHPQGVNIPTLAGLTLGRETFQSVREKFPALRTELQLWGARGFYTVAQRTPLPHSRWRLEFVYELPPDLGQGQFDRLEEEVRRRHNPAVLEPYLDDRAPYMVGLEEVR